MTPPSIAFTWHGLVPSKSNFRRGGKNWKEEWKRIKSYEHEIGTAAMAAGGRRLMGSGAVMVEVSAYNQTIDPDNLWKATMDALKGVCFEDDDPEHVRSILLRQRNDEMRPRVRIAVIWPEAREAEEPVRRRVS